jgi:hypothetical protein
MPDQHGNTFDPASHVSLDELHADKFKPQAFRLPLVATSVNQSRFSTQRRYTIYFLELSTHSLLIPPSNSDNPA